MFREVSGYSSGCNGRIMSDEDCHGGSINFEIILRILDYWNV